MAKGGISLNPGADASIVTAATAAGLSSAPGDYSKQFQSIADSYAATMESNVAMWKTIMDSTLALSKDSIIKAGERRRANIDIRNTPSGEALEGQVKGYKDRLKETWGFSRGSDEGTLSEEEWNEQNKLTDPNSDVGTYDEYVADLKPSGKRKNNPLSRENKDKRAQIYKERDAFYGEVTQMGAGLKVINEIQANGEFDAKATGAHGIELAEAFAASQTTGEQTKNGNYFESSWDPKKKKIIHTLMNNGRGEGGIPKGPVKDEDGKVRTYTTEQIQGVLIPKDANLVPAYTKYFNAAEANGKALGTEWDEYQSNKAKKAIEELVETPEGLHRSIHATFGHLDKSFQEEFTSISELSAKEYAKLASVLPSDEKGNLIKTGVLQEVDGMSDNIPGIQQSDFASADNQMKVSLAMFDKGYKHYNEQNLKDTFIEWVAGVDGKLARAHNHGMGYNARVLADKKANEKASALAAIAANKELTETTDYFASVGDTKSLSIAGVFVNKGELESKRTLIQQRRGFTIGDKLLFNPDGKNGWVKIKTNKDGDQKIIDKYNSLSDLIKNGLKTSHPGFTSLISMDVDNDGTPDGPVSLDFLNKKYYDLINKKPE